MGGVGGRLPNHCINGRMGVRLMARVILNPNFQWNSLYRIISMKCRVF